MDKECDIATKPNKYNKNKSDELFKIFFSNITTLSKHAQEYLFSSKTDSLWLVEVHNEDPIDVKNKFQKMATLPHTTLPPAPLMEEHMEAN